MSIQNKISQNKCILLFFSLLCIFSLGLGAFCLSRLNYDYNPEKAVRYAADHANKKSVSLCAYYVRLSIEAGGCPTFFYPNSACDYKTFLPRLGFKQLSDSRKPEIGDIVVFNAVKNHPHGHIAIWDGKQWISDFKQRNIIVAKEYCLSDAQYFRLNQGKHRRRFFVSDTLMDNWIKLRRDLKLLL